MMATIVVMLSACGGKSEKPGIEGKWEIKSHLNDHEYAYMEFDNEGKFQIVNVKESDKDDINEAEDKVRILGTYTFENDDLTLEVKEVVVSGTRRLNRAAEYLDSYYDGLSNLEGKKFEYKGAQYSNDNTELSFAVGQNTHVKKI